MKKPFTTHRFFFSLCALLSVLCAFPAHAQSVVSDLEVQRTVKLGSGTTSGKEGTITPAQLTANTNDWAPSGYTYAFTFRVSTDASRNLTGIAGGALGRTITLENVGSFPLVLKNNDSGSSGSNRFALNADYTLAAGSGVLLKYDGTSSRWRIVGSQTAPSTATGDVVGPSSAVDNRIAVYDSTSGKLIKDGGKTVSEINPVGSQTIWIPAVGMSPATTDGAAAAQIEGTAGRPEIAALSFDPTTQQFAQFAVAMPKSWNNSTITAQFFWSHPSTTTNFGVTWSIAGVAISDGDAIDASYGTAQTVSDTGGTTGTLYISSATSAVTIGGTPATGDLVYFHIARVPADGSDTMAVEANLIGVKIIYTTSAPTDQ